MCPPFLQVCFSLATWRPSAYSPQTSASLALLLASIRAINYWIVTRQVLAAFGWCREIRCPAGTVAAFRPVRK